MNIIEKYLAEAAKLDQVSPGQDIRCNVDLIMSHDVTAPMAIKQFEKIGVDRVFNSQKVILVVDHIFPAATVQAREMYWIMKEFSRKYGVTLFDKGQGVCHQIIHEYYNLRPGAIVLGADSHTCTAGGYGAIGIGVGSTEAAAAMATGYIDIEVPEVVEVNLFGRLKPGVTGKDLVLTLLGIFKTDGLTDKALIFTGSGCSSLSIDQRMTIANMGIEMGAMITIFTELDKDRDVAQSMMLDLYGIEPVMACPYSPENIKPVSELAGMKVTQVVVGSCTNGRISDMETVAGILKHRKVHPDVSMLVIPASKNIAGLMEDLGYSKIIREAGAVIANPGCGPCFGAHQGLTTDRDVVISTTNRNFPGRMGHKEANIYLASPLIAVYAAVEGKVVEPQEPLSAEEVS